MKKRLACSCLLMAWAVTKVCGCAWMDTHNYYLFSVCDPQEFSDRVDRISCDNWKSYMGSNDEYFYFDADEVKEAARKKGDQLMVSYVTNLQLYLDCVEQVREEKWEYPTKEQLAQRKKTLQDVRLYAQGQLKSRLRSQHALLFMRCNMMLGQHAENITFWQQTASKLIETVYKDMMKNIYAGALLKTGKPDQAVQLFAEQGDWSSLMTQFYKRRSYAAIREEYLRNPNSPVLPFLLQDFVNNAQEAIDGQKEWNFAGKLFVRDIKRSEAQQMMTFAAQVVSEGKSRQPALWQAAKAWLQYLFGDRREALADARTATTLQGTTREQDNARVLYLYISAANTKKPDSQFDKYLAREMQWLDSLGRSDEHYVQVADRTVHQVLADLYTANNRQSTALALYSSVGSYLYGETLDTMHVDHLLRFLDYAKSPAQSPIDAWLKSRLDLDTQKMNDLVGTKYLRQCRWQEAIAWLDKLMPAYFNDCGYAFYAALRRADVEPWLKRQWLKEGNDYSEEQKRVKTNPKADFAREMMDMEGSMRLLDGEALQQRRYDLAIRYSQVCYTGDCWFIMRDGKSSGDSLRTNETDLLAKAVGLLQQAAKGPNPQLKERALFALAYSGLYPDDRWFSEEWDDKVSDFVPVPNKESHHYKALANLANYEDGNALGTAKYVSRCDEYVQFRKHQKTQ